MTTYERTIGTKKLRVWQGPQNGNPSKIVWRFHVENIRNWKGFEGHRNTREEAIDAAHSIVERGELN